MSVQLMFLKLKKVLLCGRDFELLDEVAFLIGLLTSDPGFSIESGLVAIYAVSPIIIPVIAGSCSSVTTSIVF